MFLRLASAHTCGSDVVGLVCQIGNESTKCYTSGVDYVSLFICSPKAPLAVGPPQAELRCDPPTAPESSSRASTRRERERDTYIYI